MITFHKIFNKAIMMFVPLFITTSMSAQIPSYDQWFEGEIKVNDSSTYAGKIKYDFRDDIVFLKQGGVDYVFHASFIDNFQVFSPLGEHKSFVAMPYTLKNKKKIYMIFQVVFNGTKSELLTREYFYLNSSYTNSPSSLTHSKEYAEEINYYRDRTKIKTHRKYFITKKDNSVKEVRLSRQHVLKTFVDEKEKIKEFIVSNDLYFKRFGDLIKVLEYYHEIN